MEKNRFRLKGLLFQLVVCLFIIISNTIYAQNSWIKLHNGKILNDFNEQQVYIHENINGKLLTRKIEGPNDLVKIIVILNDRPLADYKSKDVLRKVSLTNVLSSIKQTHTEVISKIDNIASSLSASSNFQQFYKINREYFTSLNGIAIECSREMIRDIGNMTEVKSVHLDRVIKTNLTRSVEKIRADIVHDSLGYTGDGVLVGVLDTGIDYLHPALGGGFGPGYRVIGGYDFVSNDEDPYDDEGHGTHVSGIIGANGTSDQIGVAPNVKFLAVKVLDNNGMGYSSDIIIGIEYCLDPDGNPETDDAVNIINMSLGGSPLPDAPLDEAVNNATAAGILSVVAAGNEGDNPTLDTPNQSISSPGSAVTALTVGATYIYDRTAPFSSRGPDPINFAIKPEIAAPGVDISSLYPNNSMETFSGTSMAAPHVAGVAALLKEQHPEWTPTQIKAAIINSANPTMESVFSQGNGRVDALNAATLGMTVEPGIINFGLVDLSESVWKDTVEVRITNQLNVSQNFNLEIKTDWIKEIRGVPVEIDLELNETNFNLGPMEEKELTAILTVPESVPFIGKQPFSYTGDILCRSDSESVQIPFSFVKSNILVIECDIYPRDLALYYGPQLGHTIDILSRTGGFERKYTVTVPKGTFLLWASMREVDSINNCLYDYFIVKDSVRVEGFTNITLDKSEAKYALYDGVDHLRDVYDNPINPDSALIGFQIDYSYITWTYLGWRYKDLRIFFSPVDERFLVHNDLFLNYGDQSILLAKAHKGIRSQEELTFLSGRENLGDIHLNLDYTQRINPRTNEIINDKGPFIQFNSHEVYKDAFEGGWNFSQGYALPNKKYIHFMTPKLTEEFDPMQYVSMSINIAEFKSDPLFGMDYPIIRTGTSEFFIDESRNFVFFDRKFFRPDQKDYVKIVSTQSGDSIYIKEKSNMEVAVPKFQFLYQYYDSQDLGLTQFSPDGLEDGGIITSNGIRYYGIHSLISMHPVLDAHIYSRNRMLEENHMPSNYFIFYYDYTVEENKNKYHLQANTHSYNLLGQNGRSFVDYEFIVSDPVDKWKCILPSIDLFQVLENDKPAKWLHTGQDKKVRLVIFDPKVNVDSVNIYLLKNDGSNIRLTTTKTSPKEYIATIPDDIPNGFLDVIADVYDREGNKIKLSVSPAFYTGTELDSTHYDARIQMSSYKMENPDSVGFNENDTLKYVLTFDNYGNRIAENIIVNFPMSDYVIPLVDNSYSVDSLQNNNDGGDYKLDIPLKLLFDRNKLPNDRQYYYNPTITWNSGEITFTRMCNIMIDFEEVITSLNSFENNIPNSYTLSQNYPNPFNPLTKIKFGLPKESEVSVIVYNILGRKVTKLVDDILKPGFHEIEFNSEQLSSGVYFYRIIAENYSETKKMVLIK